MKVTSYKIILNILNTFQFLFMLRIASVLKTVGQFDEKLPYFFALHLGVILSILSFPICFGIKWK